MHTIPMAASVVGERRDQEAGATTRDCSCFASAALPVDTAGVRRMKRALVEGTRLARASHLCLWPRRHAQFVNFLVTGGIAAVANFCSRIILNRWMSYSAAIIVAYVIGMVTAFVLNRKYVFREATNPLHHQVFWFTIVNLAAVAQTLAVSLLLARWLFPSMGFHWHDETIAHAFGVAVPVLTSFIGHKHLTFPTRDGRR